LKNYGKRKIPRNILEFDDLVVPFYKSKDYSRCLDILISYWKRKGKSHSTAYSITPGVFACAFKGDLDLNIRFIYSKYSITISGFIYDNLEEFLPYFREEFILKYNSFKEFILNFYQSIRWSTTTELTEKYKSIDLLVELAPQELQYKRNWIYGKENNRNDILTNALINFELNKLATKAIKNFRESRGLGPRTARWISEQYLLDKVKTAFPNDIIIAQGNPFWLGNQRFDIWMPELNAAIEYNGIQHYEPVKLFGGIEGFEATKERDEQKRIKCDENNIALLELREEYNFKEVKDWIEQRKNTVKSRANKS